MRTWEEHLEQLKQQAEQEPESFEKDLLLPLEVCFPVFHQLHRKVVADSPNFNYLEGKQPGISVADVLRVFPGAWVVEEPLEQPKPSCCSYCDKNSVPLWRRGGKIIQRTEPDGSRYWACHFCGRRTNTNIRTATGKKRTTK